ncbi:MAG: Nif3-like dinuclear metal center hexameric protein [Gemmatimonadaceae bacterium]|nr:Nif3-like dinuclear metal center hexameric protein [Gemmatimonadaceae bacterium]
MTDLADIVVYLDNVLETASTPDFPGALNGLQLANQGSITRVAAAVDFSSQTIHDAIEQKADLLLVHHGMFWGGAKPIVGPSYERLKALLDNDIAVYSSHLPLDRHIRFGNNVQLAEQLGLIPSNGFAQYQGVAIGIQGKSEIGTTELFQRARTFAQLHGGDAITTRFPPDHVTRHWAMCTGAGASAITLQEAVVDRIDTIIVGEGPHWTAVEAGELGIVIIYAGHYATETLGVNALAQHLGDRFGLETTSIHAPTGL